MLLVAVQLVVYNLLEDQFMKGNTVGSRQISDKAYCAGFLDGDGSLMMQIKKRADCARGYRFMLTICFYQDSRHEKPLFWIQRTLGAGFISRRKDSITELRINGYRQVGRIMEKLMPYLKFKKIQAQAIHGAAQLLMEKKISHLSKKEVRFLIHKMLVIQSNNYATRKKKTASEFYSLVGLTP